MVSVEGQKSRAARVQKLDPVDVLVEEFTVVRNCPIATQFCAFYYRFACRGARPGTSSPFNGGVKRTIISSTSRRKAIVREIGIDFRIHGMLE